VSRLCIQPCLVLKEWHEFDQSMEFRIFVKNSKVVGISQRDVTVHYAHLEQARNRLLDLLIRFYNCVLAANVAVTGSDFACDM
jgi:hypothetical protein